MTEIDIFNPPKRRLFISFSGGETSAYMTYLLLTRWKNQFDEVVVLFANTGEENEETLIFVNRCDKYFNFKTVWVEAVVHSEQGVGTTHKIVNFETASRKGEPYEVFIKKFGIPNHSFPSCTRELKLRPMQSYIKLLGWKNGTYDTAIGIRVDEARRRSKNHKENRIIYPLLDSQPTTKPQINSFWDKQPFRLELTGYQGNCKWCWKKSFRKLLTIMDESPRVFDFPERMEKECGKIGPEFKTKKSDDYHRVFFRGDLSVEGLKEMYKKEKDTLDRAADDSLDFEPESSNGCSESCEINFEE